MLRAARFLIVLLVLGLAQAGCATHYIPNTDVEDNSENRKIITFCEHYRHAVELKDIGALLRMASPKYYEDGGNVDSSDDIDFEGLREYLSKSFQTVGSIRYEIRYRRISKERDVIHVDFTYSASYRIPSGRGLEWRRRVEDNRLDLVRYQDEFRILSGM